MPYCDVSWILMSKSNLCFALIFRWILMNEGFYANHAKLEGLDALKISLRRQGGQNPKLMRYVISGWTPKKGFLPCEALILTLKFSVRIFLRIIRKKELLKIKFQWNSLRIFHKMKICKPTYTSNPNFPRKINLKWDLCALKVTKVPHISF